MAWRYDAHDRFQVMFESVLICHSLIENDMNTIIGYICIRFWIKWWDEYVAKAWFTIYYNTL